MSHPLLDQLDQLMTLLERADKLDDMVAKNDLTKYLRWASRKVAKAYWYSIEHTHIGD
jgi:hypothetical protein